MIENLAELEVQVSRELWKKKPAEYFRDRLKIADEHGKKVPFEINIHQKAINEAIERQREEGKPVRIVVLKPRKTGSSTYSEGELFRCVLFHPADALIVSKDQKSTDYLFEIARRFYDSLPEDERPILDRSNVRELRFKPRSTDELAGSIFVATAGRDTTGRSFTPLYLHCSEVAFYPEAEIVMTSLLNSVPDTPESMVIIESTANGMGGYFHRMWELARNGSSGFEAVFLSWKNFVKYSMAVPDARLFELSLNPTEKKLRKQHDLTLEQLYWRRWTIATKLNGDEEKFRQEFPLTAEEAFLTSGRGRLDREIIQQWQTSDPIKGFLQSESDYDQKRLAFIPSKEGWLSVWRRPQSGHQYVIGADVAEGIETEGATREDLYDHCSADILDAGTGEQVAQIHGDFEPDEYGRMLAMVGKWYNTAFIGVERNNNGQTTLNELGHTDYPTASIFSRTFTPDGGRYSTPQQGWLTTVVTRPNLINRLAQGIRERAFIVNSARTQQECLSFVIKKNGRVEAQSGSKDDCVISLGIALEMLNYAPSTDLDRVEINNEPVLPRPLSYRAEKYAAIR